MLDRFAILWAPDRPTLAPVILKSLYEELPDVQIAYCP